jgi:hypothetical protein
MEPFLNTQLGCACDNSQLYNPFKIMNITSQILDFETGQPVDTVNVYFQNNPNKGTITNVDGMFQIEATPDDIIVLSHVAYGQYPIKAKEIQPVEYIQKQTNVLDEVVVFAKKKKTWLWGALAALGLVVLVSGSDEENKKKPVKAKV